MTDSPIHFEGTIPNESGTPRNEVGGLAVFEGVMMRSRTGFAIAQRLPDGTITLTQFPFASLIQRSRTLRLPFLRGATSLSEMMLIGTRAMNFAAATLDPAPAKEDESRGARLGLLILGSLAAMVLLLVVLPNLIVTFAGEATGLSSVMDADGAGGFNELDHPILYNLMTGGVRLLILTGYVAVLSLSADIRRVFEYHGAEHKAVLALEEGRDVTVDRARRHDTLHPRCGTMFLALLAIVSIIGFATGDSFLMLHVSGYPDWSLPWRKCAQFLIHLAILPILVSAVFEFIKFAGSRADRRWVRVLMWPGFLLQRLTTRQPDDRQLEVAIVALFGALAIPRHQRSVETYVVRGLEDDETAPGFVAKSPARPAPPRDEFADFEESSGEKAAPGQV